MIVVVETLKPNYHMFFVVSYSPFIHLIPPFLLSFWSCLFLVSQEVSSGFLFLPFPRRFYRQYLQSLRFSTFHNQLYSRKFHRSKKLANRPRRESCLTNRSHSLRTLYCIYSRTPPTRRLSGLVLIQRRTISSCPIVYTLHHRNGWFPKSEKMFYSSLCIIIINLCFHHVISLWIASLPISQTFYQ